jgi:cyclopropane fatty-acyl-phospholipid synthase-like methyltransferase
MVGVLKRHLPAGSSVLELGMGPGRDLDLLRVAFEATGSDRSTAFLDLYRRTHPDADLLQLDAVVLDTDRRFDALYSNKVLHHLPRGQMIQSLARQREILHDGGLAMHSFWQGEDDGEEHEGLLFTRFTEAQLEGAFEGAGFEVVEMKGYSEMNDDDSIYVVARKAGRAED